MPSKMPNEEILSFQGHEFTYVFEDGDTMPAYIKKIDLDKELISCWSFSMITDNGTKLEPINDEEELEDACCLTYGETLNEIIKIITEIKTTGKYLVDADLPGFFYGCPF